METFLDGARQRYHIGSQFTDILGVRAGDEELLASLKNLSLLQDVIDMVTEMDADDFVCLSSLRRLACGRHLEQSPEKEISSIFYVEPPQPAGLTSWLSSWIKI